MHFTYTFPSYLCTSIYMYSICMYTGGGSKVTEPEALETKIKEITIQT